ncbi:SVP1-like protein 2 [Fulvia fulva]|uniref:SVP1-like protein 2 n=1 Tax=Passalora fulva TaxID=5499 RepID=A0A9Q8P942_PASFU|nr:SVP1-like protein 2 [Fulvia fulva]KAK4623953.1 SVP1-like protein 2 [Fulvia fulva]KAK4625325.1 SVP1-like protein 2 [Fulvia fulva]UJO17879.1 SVP1-like protein 2 [Fulvia fulva]WPV14818.1 SVP1-like protein 2 [Fulvia fulva]WPV30156.1 SVP1-like protein 2 [Fulvia fulva]
MNTRQAIQPLVNANVLSVSYSPSRKRFCTALNDGLRVFRTDNCLTTTHLPFECGIAVAEALDDRYYAFVCSHKGTIGGPGILVFWDTITDSEVTRFDFHEPVLGLRLSSRWLAVVLEERTIVFQYQKIHPQAPPTPPADDSDSQDTDVGLQEVILDAPNAVHSLHRTAANPFAVASLANDLLALPAQSVGQVQLISLKSGGGSTKRVVRAHNSSLRCLALSSDASLLATASEQGTLIRVYSTKTLDQIAEHRRGMDHAIIQCLAFSPGNKFVASTSDKGTLHVFDLRPTDSSEIAPAPRDQRQHRKSQSYATHRLSGTNFDSDSLSGVSAGRSSPSRSTAIAGGAGTAYQGSVQEYYGLRPPPPSATPPARDVAVSAIAALKASPFAPRVFKDQRSVASAPFYTGEDPPHWQGGPAYSWTVTPNGGKKRVKNAVLPLPNDPTGRPPKGIMAFAPGEKGVSDDDGAVIYVVGGGSDARWEMFSLVPAVGSDGVGVGGWVLVNRGFRKYLTRQFAE